jgi:hypothetical protein
MLGLGGGVVNTTTASTPLEELQNRFAIIDMSGEVRLVDQLKIDDILHGNASGDPAFYKKVDATLLMKRALEKLPYPCKPEVVINDFLVSPSTLFYQGTAFTPKLTPPEILNFWIPPTLKAVPGDCRILTNFIRDIICNGDLESFEYLMNFLAHMVQNPEEKPGVMIVLLGGQGTGKGVFFRMLRAIWSRTCLLVSDINQVIGQFNACLEHNFVICFDEALFAGDRKSLDRLKSLVTEPHIRIENKYQPARSIESVHRFFAASNHDHFAHVEQDDRRFAFFRVSDSKQQNTEYFRTIVAAINDDLVMSALMDQLKKRDLSNFDVRKKPSGAEHMKQKIKSLQGFDRYWFEVLGTGDLAADDGSEFRLASPWIDSKFVPTSKLMRCYTDYNKSAQRYEPFQSSELAARLQRLCPSAIYDRKVSEVDGHVASRQQRGYELPELATARAEFEGFIGGKIRWDD